MNVLTTSFLGGSADLYSISTISILVAGIMILVSQIFSFVGNLILAFTVIMIPLQNPAYLIYVYCLDLYHMLFYLDICIPVLSMKQMGLK